MPLYINPKHLLLISCFIAINIDQTELRKEIFFFKNVFNLFTFPRTHFNRTVYPETKSTLETLKLSVYDLPMLSCHYIQKCLLFTHSHLPINSLISHLKHSLSITLTHFPPLAGRLTTDLIGFVHVSCNDAGATFIHASATHLSIHDVLSPTDVPEFVKGFFTLDGIVSYDGHFNPILAVQVTELSDGVFIGCTVNHAVMDGPSFWNFLNIFAEVSRGVVCISRVPDFGRNIVKDSLAVLPFLDGPPKVTFDVDAPLRVRIFHFNREAVLRMKSIANFMEDSHSDNKLSNDVEIMGKLSNDVWLKSQAADTLEISSFQSLCDQLWRSITRARKLTPQKETTFRMTVNCRTRLEPRVSPQYFSNAIQSIPTIALAGDVLSKDLRWCARLLHENVVAYDSATVCRVVENWEKNPRVFPATVTMGSSPRFPMFDNDFGWGAPLAVRSGRANKFDGKISAFPGREGYGSVDLEVCLDPETMAGLETDEEIMQYVMYQH